MGPAASLRIPLRKTFVLSGRSSRREFWWTALVAVAFIALGFQVLAFIVAFPIGFKEGFAAQQASRPFSMETIKETFALYVLGTFLIAQMMRILVGIPLLRAVCKRLRDTGRSMLMVFSIIPGSFVLTLLIVAYSNSAGWDMVRLGNQVGQYSWLFLLVSSGPLIWFLTRPSQPGTNRYGPNPSEAIP